jgi:hypothetical protein
MNRDLKAVGLSVSFVALLAAPVFPAESESTTKTAPKPENSIKTGALGAASLLATIPYSMAKIGYAIVGAIAGGLNYAEGDKEAAQEIWQSSIEGTYLVTPDHLSGKKPVEFFGGDPGSAERNEAEREPVEQSTARR